MVWGNNWFRGKQQGLFAVAEQKAISELKILVVDDSRTICRTAEVLLGEEGCNVITAEDGYAALAKLVSEKPDLVFLDIMMPRVDGFQACAIIKNNPNYKDLPVIMLTSKDGLVDRARGRLVGATYYLTKPFTREELIGAVKGALDTNAANDDA
jgi:twitching motility two-component system response regulator PilG